MLVVLAACGAHHRRTLRQQVELVGCDADSYLSRIGIKSYYGQPDDWPKGRHTSDRFTEIREVATASDRVESSEHVLDVLGIRHEPQGKAELVFYIAVPDLDVAVAKAKELGAQIRIPPMQAPEVTFALILDPEGNPIGLVQKK